MLGVLSYIQSLFGRRTVIVFVALTVLGLFVFEVLANARSYFETYIQMRMAEVAAKKTQAEAEKARADAERAAAEAKTAEEVQKNAEFRQREEALKLREERLKVAEERRTATAVADNSAERQAAEAAKAKADAVSAGANAIIQSRIAAAVAGSGGDNGRVVRDLEGALGDPFEAGAKPAKSPAEVYYDTQAMTAPNVQGFGGRSSTQEGQGRIIGSQGGVVARETNDFDSFDGFSFTLGKRSKQQTATVEECETSCLTRKDFICVGGTFFKQSGSCTLYDRLNTNNSGRNPDAIGFVRRNQQIINGVVTAVGNAGNRLFNQQYNAVGRLIGEK